MNLSSLRVYRQKWLVWHALPWLAAVAIGLLLARMSLPAAVLLLGATAVVLLTLIQPLIGLGVALLLGPLGAWEALFLGGFPLDSSQIALLLTLLAWLARGLRDRRLIVPRLRLAWPLILFVFLTLLTLFDAPSLNYGLVEVVKWLEIGLVAGLVAVELKREQMPLLLGVLVLAGVTQALLGLWQFALQEDGPAHFLVLGRFYRAFGTFMQPNPYGGFMGMTALLAAGALTGVLMDWWHRGRQETDARLLRWLLPLLALLAATGVAGAALVASWSRGAWLGFAAGTAVFIFLLPRRRAHGFWLALVVGAAAGVLLLAGIATNRLPAGVVGRITSSFSEDLRFDDVRGVDITDANYAILERLAHWQAAFGMARDEPWLGVGFGNYEPAYPEYRLINWPDALGHAHNYYINLLAEVGVLGVLGYFLFWTAVFWQNSRILQRLSWPERGIALGLVAIWTALAVHHLVDKLYVNNLYIYFGALLGLQQILDNETDVAA